MIMLSDNPGAAPISPGPFPWVQQELQARMDTLVLTLWSPQRSVALESAGAIYRADGDFHLARESVGQEVARVFLRLLVSSYPGAPETFEARYRALLETLGQLLRQVRAKPDSPFIEEYLTVGLRPVRRLWLDALAPEVCAALYDYHRGVWAPYLTKPQLHVIDQALAMTVAAMHPDAMNAFWQRLQSPDPLMRDAMLLALKYLRAAHSVPHLLHGLEHIQDHSTRAAIVDCLEQIAEPGAITTLIRLRRETAYTDWTLSRQMARAIRVIEQQNRNQQQRTLLRPADTPPDMESSLLRPMGPASSQDEETLLRSPRQALVETKRDGVTPGD